MDYNSLVAPKSSPGSIAGWLAYSDQILPLADILTDAQAFIYQTLRCREMLVPGYAIALAPGAQSAPLPAGFLDPYWMSDQYLCEVKHKDLGTIRKRRNVDSSGAPVQSQPRYYCVTGTTFEFDCAANAAMTFTADYYGTPAPLSALNDTNFLTIRYPHVLRTACLAAGSDFLKDDAGYQKFTQRLAAMIADLQVNDDLSMRGGQSEPDYSEASPWR